MLSGHFMCVQWARMSFKAKGLLLMQEILFSVFSAGELRQHCWVRRHLLNLLFRFFSLKPSIHTVPLHFSCL